MLSAAVYLIFPVRWRSNGLSVAIVVCLDVWYILILLATFLSLLGVRRQQWVLGVVSLLILAISFPFGTGMLLASMLYVPPLFWLFVIVASLAIEAAVFQFPRILTGGTGLLGRLFPP
jgi:hypothetical protein